MARLEPGQKAPDFTLQSDSGEEISLKSLKGSPVVLYFYPKAMTSGCTVQACDYRDRLKDFSKLGAHVLAVSPDPVARLAKFRDKEGLTFSLLSDESHAVLEAYGVWVEKSMYGKKYMGIVRSAFLIQDGVVLNAWYKISPADTPTNLLKALKK